MDLAHYSDAVLNSNSLHLKVELAHEPMTQRTYLYL